MSPLQPDALLGTWELASFHVESDDGRPHRFPFGRSAQGRIVYAADGLMVAMLSRGTDATAPSLSLETAHHASDRDKAAAFDRTLAYSGRWRLDGDSIVHDVDLALAPGVVGRAQVRRVTWSEGPPVGLTLSYTRTSRRGTTHRFVLVWRRPAA